MQRTPREKFTTIISNDLLLPSDVVVVLEGDFYCRADRAIELFRSKLAGLVLVSGGLDKSEVGSYHGDKVRNYLITDGKIPSEKILLETESTNTRQQAMNVMKLVKENNWKAIILVVSHFHQFRAYLTFLKAMRDVGLEILMFNVPVRNITWFEKELPKTRLELLEDEFDKIEEYKKSGHIASFEEAIGYQRWKEKEAKKYGDYRI